MFEVATTDSISYFLRAESREEHRRWIKGLKELCQLRDYPVGRAVHGAPSPKKHHKGIDDKNLPISSKNEAVTSTTSDGVSSASLEGRARETSLQSDSSLSMKIGSRSDQIEVVADGEEDGNEIADAEFKDSESTDTTAFAGTKPPPAAISLSRLEEEDVHRLVSDDSKAKLHSIESAIKRRQQRSSTSGRSAIHPAEGAHSASPGQISGKGPSKARSKLFAKGLTPTKQKKIEPYRADSNFTHADWDDQKQSAGPPAFENYGEPSTNDEMYEDWDQDTSEQTQGKESKTGPNKNSEREVLNKNDDGTADSHTKWVSEPFDDDETTEEQDLQTPMKPSLRASNGDQNRNSPGVPADSVSVMFYKKVLFLRCVSTNFCHTGFH